MPINQKLVDLALEGKVNYETVNIPEIGMLRIIYVLYCRVGLSDSW